MNQELDERLFEAYARHELSAEERLQLKQRLENEPSLRQAFAEHMLQRSALISAQRKNQQLQHQNESGKHRLAQRKRARRARRPIKRSTFGLRLAANFLLCLGLAAIYAFFPSEPTAPIIVADDGAAVLLRGGQEIPLQDQQVLAVADEIHMRSSGRVELHFADGTTLQLHTGRLRLDAWQKRKQLFLQQGSLSADVAKQAAAPMRIDGTHCAATILGTRFFMREAADWAELRVDHGLVEYERVRDGARLAVGAGQQARLAAGVPWTVFEQGQPPACRLPLADARIEKNGWQVAMDQGMRVLDFPADGQTNELSGLQVGAPLRQEVFIEADQTYTLWICARHMPSERALNHTDQVFVQIPGAQWQYDYETWRQAKGWEFLPKNPSVPIAILNGWATYAPEGTWYWVAGPASKGDKGVPQRLHFTAEKSGLYEMSVYPMSGPTRVSEIYLTAGDEHPQD